MESSCRSKPTDCVEVILGPCSGRHTKKLVGGWGLFVVRIVERKHQFQAGTDVNAVSCVSRRDGVNIAGRKLPLGWMDKTVPESCQGIYLHRCAMSSGQYSDLIRESQMETVGDLMMVLCGSNGLPTTSIISVMMHDARGPIPWPNWHPLMTARDCLDGNRTKLSCGLCEESASAESSSYTLSCF